jgi:hypothetical protein
LEIARRYRRERMGLGDTVPGEETGGMRAVVGGLLCRPESGGGEMCRREAVVEWEEGVDMVVQGMAEMAEMAVGDGRESEHLEVCTISRGEKASRVLQAMSQATKPMDCQWSADGLQMNSQ